MGRLSKQIQNDLDSHLQQSYNRLIAKIMRRLATKKRSPVWTGFFASSWKAQTQSVRTQDKVEDFEPWSVLKKRRDKGDTGAYSCLLYTSPSPRDVEESRMPSSA